MKDLGAAQKILGMEIYRERDKNKLFLCSFVIVLSPQSEAEKEYMSRVPYASAVGSLIGTSDVGLVYGNCTECLVTGYSDSNYARDVDSRRSMTGYVFTLGGSIVSWKATLQPTVTCSTTEAEYMALIEVAKEGIWLRGCKISLLKR
ncbi:secreted RxLR effector protein 161-like [Benincasa hispida]|uniref:secreted RxLR effector protein 161-like n=1 Tax=Benincasa hispida TaxID=102211 RepID=UPI0019017AD4|nr:secreted RxLR effector protein 161-like [Benincasa hispida]